MKPLYHFIIEPKDGELYNTKSGGLLLSATYENVKATQRVARVIECPIRYSGVISPGDFVITHHNVFRKSYSMKGDLSNGSDFLEEGKYLVDEDRMYMHSKDGTTWNALYPFVFVSPIKSDDDLLSSGSFKKEHGRVEHPSHKSVSKGDIVRFTPDSECEFIINGELMYRMKQSDLIWKVL